MSEQEKPKYGTPEYDEYLRERRCGRKIQYSGKQVAANAATALSWVDATLFGGLEPYHCDYCDCWHLGHPYFRGYALGFIEQQESEAG